MSKSINRGFTLIELMLVIAVLGIIAAIAYPSFIGQIQKARRADAKQALFDVAAKLEQYYQDNKGYPTVANMDLLYPDVNATTFTSVEGHYTIGFNGVPTATTYSIQAVPTGAQFKDSLLDPDNNCDEIPCCGNFRLNSLGQKSVEPGTSTLPADRCW